MIQIDWSTLPPETFHLHKEGEGDCNWVTINGRHVCIGHGGTYNPPKGPTSGGGGKPDIYTGTTAPEWHMGEGEGFKGYKVVTPKGFGSYESEYRIRIGEELGDTGFRTGGFYDSSKDEVWLNPNLKDPDSLTSKGMLRRAELIGLKGETDAYKYAEEHEIGHAFDDKYHEIFYPGSTRTLSRDIEITLINEHFEDVDGRPSERFADFYAFYRRNPSLAVLKFPESVSRLKVALAAVKEHQDL